MMDAEEFAHLRRLRDQYERNVWTLKEQAAEHGLAVPLGIANGIEEFEAKIAELDRQLELAQAQGAAATAVAAPAAAGHTSAVVLPGPSTPLPSASSEPASLAPHGRKLPRNWVLYSGIASLLIGSAWASVTVDGSAGAGFFLVLGFGLVVGWLIYVALQRKHQRGQ
jgi:hypothetical protein